MRQKRIRKKDKNPQSTAQYSLLSTLHTSTIFKKFCARITRSPGKTRVRPQTCNCETGAQLHQGTWAPAAGGRAGNVGALLRLPCARHDRPAPSRTVMSASQARQIVSLRQWLLISIVKLTDESIVCLHGFRISLVVPVGKVIDPQCSCWWVRAHSVIPLARNRRELPAFLELGFWGTNGEILENPNPGCCAQSKQKTSLAIGPV